MSLGKLISVVTSSSTEKPTNFCRVCSRKASRSFCRTFGAEDNSLIVNFDVGSTLDASLINEVIDSDELSDELKTMVLPSSSDEALLLVELLVDEPSLLAASVFRTDCLVKLCRFARRALLLVSTCPCISKRSAPADSGDIDGMRAMTLAGFSVIGSR